MWSWSQQLRVSCTLKPFSDSDGGAVARGSRGLGPPLASQRHESDIATQRLAKRCSPVRDKVEAAAIGWVDVRGGFAEVHGDARPSLDGGGHNVKRLARAGRCCDNVNVVQEGREALAGAQLRVCGDEGVVLAQGVQRRG